MRTLLDYMKEHGGENFDRLPFNELDAAVFSQLVYLPLERALRPGGTTLKAAADALRGTPCGKVYEFMLRPRLETLRLAGLFPRWRDIVIADFKSDTDPKAQKQFCAMTCLLPGRAVVAFRGTDLTLTGWKEDLNMAFQSPVPAQRDAADYLTRQAEKNPLPLIVCGHSKGGNLAMYAGFFAESAVRARIEGVYPFDGPGLRRRDLDRRTPPLPPVYSFLPRGSVVGIIFRPYRPYVSVKCPVPGLWQHDPYLWQTEDTRFARAHGLSLFSRLMDDTLDDWLNSLSEEDQKIFVDTLYRVISAAGTDLLGDVVRGGIPVMRRMLDAAISLPRPVRGACMRVVRRLNHCAVKKVRRYLFSPALCQKEEA